MIVAAACSIMLAAVAGCVVIVALQIVRHERHAFSLERLGYLDRLERQHSSTAALVDEHGAIISQLLKQHHEERTILLAEHRSDMRELLNRIQHPHAMPTATVRPQRPPNPDENASERARRAWTGVGRAQPPVAPTADELGDDVP